MYYWCCHFCARWLNARAKTRRACVRILVYYTTLNVVLCIAELHYPTIKHVIPFAYICCCCRFCCHCWLLAAVVCSFYSPLPFMPIYNGRRKERKRKKKTEWNFAARAMKHAEKKAHTTTETTQKKNIVHKNAHMSVLVCNVSVYVCVFYWVRRMTTT